MRAFLATTLGLLLGASGAAQNQGTNSAASANYFVASIEFGSAEDTNTTIYRLQGSQGSGVVNEPDAGSATYRMRGGFYGALTSPVLGQPWLTGAVPYYVKPRTAQNVVLHGTELWLGTSPLVTVGGQPAANIVRTVDQMTVNVPALQVPGVQPVAFTNNVGATTLVDGVAVLPLVEKREPLNGIDPNFVRFRTQPGDFLVLIVGLAPAPGLAVLDFHHQLLIDPNQVTLTELLFVGSPDGTITFPLFGFPTGIAHVQVLALTSDPAYAPGMFSNMVVL